MFISPPMAHPTCQQFFECFFSDSSSSLTFYIRSHFFNYSLFLQICHSLSNMEVQELLKVVRDNNLHAVHHLLELGSRVEGYAVHEERSFATPLRAACALGHFDVMLALVHHGANCFSHFNEDGWSALHAAADHGHDEIIKYFIENDLACKHDQIDFNGFGIIHLICEILSDNMKDYGVEILKFAVKKLRPNLQEQSTRAGFVGWTPLHILALRGRNRAVAFLLRVQADAAVQTAEFHLQSGRMYELSKQRGTVSMQIEPDSEFVAEDIIDEGLFPLHLVLVLFSFSQNF